MISKIAVFDALKEVIDPELGMNIMDLGLVYHVETGEKWVNVEFTLTYPGCPLSDVLVEDIQNTLKEKVGAEEVHTQIVWDPPWTTDFMSEEARLILGYPI